MLKYLLLDHIFEYMAFLNRNIDNASQLKFWPSIIFSPDLEKHIDKLADIHSVHPDSLAVILLNFVATSLEFSFVLRANSIANKIPTNIYNIIVARSCKFLFFFVKKLKITVVAYGKSELTKILRDMLQTLATYRPNKFRSKDQVVVGDPINPTFDEMSKAGLMTGLNDCCRTIVCDEADMTFTDAGIFKSYNAGRISAEIDCRGASFISFNQEFLIIFKKGLVMTLFDRVSHDYIRQLSNRSVLLKKSKLNILVCQHYCHTKT